MLKSLFSIIILSLSFCATKAQTNISIDTSLWQPNGEITKMKILGDTLIIAGSFSAIGPNAPYAAIFDTSGSLSKKFPFANGQITKALADDKGGFYVAGDFTRIGNQTNGGLAYIDSTGNVTPFFRDMAVNGKITAMGVNDSLLFISGGLKSINEFTGGAAMVKLDTAEIDFNFPKIEGTVRVIEPDGEGGFYIGGKFTKVADYFRENLAHVNKYGKVLPWNPGTDDEVRSIQKYGKTIFAGGLFTYAGCQSRYRLAAFENDSDVPDSTIDFKTSDFSGFVVNDLLVYGGKFYVALGSKDFQTGPGALVVVNLNTKKIILNYSTNLVRDARVLEKGKGIVYLGTATTGTGLAANENLLKIDTTVLTNITPLLGTNYPIPGTISALKLKGDSLFVGSNSTTYGPLCIVSISTINRLPGIIAGTGVVNCIEVENDSTLIFGGTVQLYTDYSFFNLGKINIKTSKILSWNPKPLKNLHDIKLVNKNFVYCGGEFITMAGDTASLFAISANSGKVVRKYYVNGTINAMKVVDTALYVGGSFNNINGKYRNNLAKLSTINDSVSSWNPIISGQIDGQITCMALKGDTVILGGWFTKINTISRPCLAAINRHTGTLYSLPINITGLYMEDMVLKGNTLFLKGGFNKINNIPKTGIAMVDVSNGRVSPFDVSGLASSYSLFSFTPWKNYVVIGAAFLTSFNDRPRKHIAIFDTATSMEIPLKIIISDIPDVLTVSKKDELFIGGRFNMAGGILKRGLAFINLKTGKPFPWSADIHYPGNSNDGVYDFDIIGNRIYYVGNFDTVKGVSRNYIACNNLSNDSLLPWNPSVNAAPVKIVIANNKAFIVGLFTTVNGNNVNRMGALDANTGQIISFNPLPSTTGSLGFAGMALINNDIHFSSNFTSFNGVSRDNYVSFDASSLTVNSFAPKFTFTTYLKAARTIFASGNTFYIGGDYSSIDTVQTFGFVRGTASNYQYDSWKINSTDMVIPYGQYKTNLLTITGRSRINNECRCSAAIIDTTTKKLLAWSVKTNYGTGLVMDDNRVYLGGQFTILNNLSKSYLVGARIEAVEMVTLKNNNFCQGGMMNIKIETSGKFDSTNKFILMMSDTMGSFKYPLYLDTISTSADSFQYKIPFNFPIYNNYSLRVFSTRPALEGSKEIFVNILPQPKADFTVDDPYQCLYKNTFKFTNSSNLPGTLRWDFGDSLNKTKQQEYFAFKSEGVKNIKLVLFPFGNGCPNDSIIKQVQVLPQPLPSFIINDSIQCNHRDSFAFTNKSTISKGSMRHFWDFGNSKTDTNKNTYTSYIDTGVYIVTLIATSDSSCVDSNKRKVWVINKPKASFTSNSISQCLAGNNFTFTNTSTPLTNFILKWNLGDGDTSSQPIVNKSFTKDSSFTVKLFVVKDSACFDSSFKIIHVNPQPKSSFIVDTLVKCANDSFLFTNTSTIKMGSITKHEWDFGDGNNATITSPHYRYDSVESFKILLTVTSDSVCVDTLSKHIVTKPLPVAGFKINDTVQCFKTQLFLFTDLSTPPIGDSIATYFWYLGDSTTSTLKNPTHTYSDTGYYFVTLKVTGAKGCSDTARLISIVAPEPVIGSISGPIVVQGTETHAYTIVNDTFTTYFWGVNNGTLVLGPDSTSATITWDSVTSTTNAKISIIPINIAGCIGDTAFLNVQIDPFSIGIDNPSLNELKIYPNPARKSFYISVNNTDISSGSVEIVDALGKVVYSKAYQQLSNSELDIDVSNLSPGIYQVSFSNAQYKAIAKIVLLNE